MIVRPRAGLALALAAAIGGAFGGCTRVGVAPEPAQPRTGPIGVALPDAPSGAPAAPEASPLPESAGGTSRAPLRFDEVRGLWVVRFSLASPASVRAVVERASWAGFNTLIVQVRGRGDAFYASALEPRGAALAGAPADFDPLREILDQAHALGMAVHAWVNVGLVSDLTAVPTDPRHVVRAHPEALMVPRALARALLGTRPGNPRYAEELLAWSRANRNRVEGLYVSPWSPAVRERTTAVVLDLVERYDLDGIHFDYIRYPGPDFDYSAGALAAFRDWAAPLVGPDRRRSLDRAAATDPLVWPDGLPDAWADFRRQQMTSLLERIQFGLKTRRPWMVVSAAVYPDTLEARQTRFQDWPAWARSGLLDAVAPMAYTADDGRFRGQVAEAVAALPHTEVWAGIGSYMTGLEGTLRKILIARELGTRGIVLFSYDWAVDPSGGGETFLERVGQSSFR